MIKNVVFDIGNVLGHFCWERVLEEIMDIHGELFDDIANATVKSAAWKELDRSLISDEEIIDMCVKNAPQHENLVREFFTHLGEVVEDYPYSVSWIKELKEKGLNVYILSNYGKTSFRKCLENGHMKYVDEIDGALISYQVNIIKPEPEIYQALFQKFNLTPEECVFIDDVPENIEGAKAQGMKGIVFKNYEQAKSELNNIIA